MKMSGRTLCSNGATCLDMGIVARQAAYSVVPPLADINLRLKAHVLFSKLRNDQLVCNGVEETLGNLALRCFALMRP